MLKNSHFVFKKIASLACCSKYLLFETFTLYSIKKNYIYNQRRTNVSSKIQFTSLKRFQAQHVFLNAESFDENIPSLLRACVVFVLKKRFQVRSNSFLQLASTTSLRRVCLLAGRGVARGGRAPSSWGQKM